MWTWVSMTAMYGLTIVLATALNVDGLPALPFLSFGFLVPNADLLWRLRRPKAPATDGSAGGGVTFFAAFLPGDVLIAVSPIANAER